MDEPDGWMTAAVLERIPSAEFALRRQPRPRVEAPTDAVLRVGACGMCGTDAHIVAGRSYRPQLPFVLGHEIVGEVTAAGEEARDWLGRRVAVSQFRGCGTCLLCRRGDARLCQRMIGVTGVHDLPGGYAEYVRVRADQLVTVPEELTDATAAALVDGGTTARNTADTVCRRPRRHVLIVGAGAVGWLTGEILHARGVDVSFVESSDARRDAVRDRGWTVVPTLAEVTAVPDAVVDAAGAPDLLATGLDLLEPGGEWIAAAYATVPDFDVATVSRKELTVTGVRAGTRDQLHGVLRQAAAGELTGPAIREYALSDINDALAAITGASDAKPIVVPGTS